MANPTLPQAIDVLGRAKNAIDALLQQLILNSPSGLVAEEQAIKDAIDAALSAANLEIGAVTADISAALDVVKHFGGIVGPGVGPDLA